ncbi:MAG: hypothetical protein PWQ10_90 [Patescibacteria group bacterium]|nr:hypothetical protein [Patescibacteria group bacterium]
MRGIITDMKPEISLPQPSPEQRDVRLEVNPTTERINHSLESSPAIGAEHLSRASEISNLPNDVTFTTSLPTPVNSQSVVVDDTSLVNNPLIANDDDLIEKEWVERAKKIVTETKNDPYRREENISKLQIDYIKKRYGRDLGVAE